MVDIDTSSGRKMKIGNMIGQIDGAQDRFLCVSLCGRLWWLMSSAQVMAAFVYTQVQLVGLASLSSVDGSRTEAVS